jgi:hypothetical protein
LATSYILPTLIDPKSKLVNMKHKILAICTIAFLVSCNSETKDTKTEGSDTTTSTSVDKDTKKDEAWIPVDSATEMKAWMEYATPGAQHTMLAKSNGEWKADVTAWMGKDAPAMKSEGSSTNKMIMGGRYQQSSFKGNMMGMPFNGMSITGYDNAKKKFVSTWIDEMGTGIMKMEGPWDEATKSMTLVGKCVSPANGQEFEMKEVFRIVDDKTQVMEMYGPDSKTGVQYKTMEITFTKK